jgi:hypothetical protein
MPLTADDNSVFSGLTKDDLSCSVTSNNSTSTKTASTIGDTKSGSIKRQLAKKESENDFKLRIVVILILVIVAAVVSILVYKISRSSKDDKFSTQFKGASTQIVEAFKAITSQCISALSSLEAVAAIAHGVDHSRNWPFVALSSFQQRAFTTRSNSGVLQVSIHPFVMSGRSMLAEAKMRSGLKIPWIIREKSEWIDSLTTMVQTSRMKHPSLFPLTMMHMREALSFVARAPTLRFGKCLLCFIMTMST